MTTPTLAPKVGGGETATDALQLRVNGAAAAYPCGSSIADLLLGLGLAGKRVAVEHNGEIVPRSLHLTTQLAIGDHVEIVVAVGGG